MKYISNDKRIYAGNSPLEIVNAMRDDSFERCDSVEAFMRRTAAVASNWAKRDIRHDFPENFIDDLLAAKILFPFSGN